MYRTSCIMHFVEPQIAGDRHEVYVEGEETCPPAGQALGLGAFLK